ncbi:ATP-binding protein [Alkalitalea saponilacus]|uniref:histidine kinase n=1 Tax=Alkalitalea saponilacus TaxID=889453 RepID=A0A1T5D4V3_9BACT|nr:tetratricopeptide repeat-containing sensor histidine kinase [Alkalitalea saponilacus]ASB50577.1 hypothetical protein CDL62_16210 [Alkalitalea saponilacus]SKB66725.1 Signal transduction histidine kinase [Alkalitalea saponilacus]
MMKKKKCFYYTSMFLFISTFYLFSSARTGYTAQSPEDLMTKIDSLEQLLLYEEACVLTHELLEQYANFDETDRVLLCRAYLKKSFCFGDEGKTVESIVVLEKALAIAMQIKDSTLLSIGYRELGYRSTIAGNYEQGFEAYRNALEIDTKLNAYENIAISLNAIGKIHELWKQFDKALDFFYQSLAIAEHLNNLDQIAIRKASIASAYKSMQNFDLALDYLERSLALETELNNEVRMGYRMDQMGEIFTILGDFEKAEEKLLSALEIFRNNRILVSESIVLNHIGFNYMKKNDYENALNRYIESLAIAEQTGFNNMKQKNLRELSSLMQKKKNYSEALEYYKQFVAIRDSAFTEQARRQLLDFQVKYESEHKEKELAIMNQKRLEDQLKLNQARQQHILMFGIVTILIFLLGTLYSRFQIKKRAQIKLSEANRQLNLMNQTKNKFFTILAHDLKNPIYAFRNISTSVHENYAELSREDLKYYTGELKNTSEKLCAFLDDLLKWAASITGRLVPKADSIELKPLFEKLVDLCSPMAKSKKLSISVDIPNGHLVWADRNMINTIFRNIISNAIKFTPENGWIKIQSNMQSIHTEIKISDSGIGILPKDLPKLFDIGNDPSRIGNSNDKGMGFGLFLCKEFIDKNNGEIRAESQPGNGTIFQIVLPNKQPK